MNKDTQKTMFSSDSQEWETPSEIFDPLHERHRFTLDVCATAKNAKCPDYFTKADDALSHYWNGVCWMNPPYGRNVTGKWVEKAYNETRTNPFCELVVCLLPARTDTKWFHDYIWRGGHWTEGDSASIDFIRGRVKFVGAKHSAPFPSMIVTFRANYIG